MKRYFYIIISIIVLSIMPAMGSPDNEPPPAILKIGENEQISGISSYCWFESGSGSCADMIGTITEKEPLLASSPFTANLRLPLPPQELQINVFRVTADDEIKRVPDGFRFRTWNTEGNYSRLPLERDPDINISLEPGLYVLEASAGWKQKGEVTYSFLIDVQDNSAGVRVKCANSVWSAIVCLLGR